MIQLVKPCRGHVTQRYAAIQSQDGRKHTGQDYAYYSGGQIMDEVFAAADGVVLYAGDSRDLNWPNAWYLNPDFNRNDAVDSSAGNVVVLGHKQGRISFDTTYNHLAAWTVRTGDHVKAGRRIATIGATGYSAGKHLHFELLFRPFNFGTDVYGRADPNPYFTDGITPQGSIDPSEEDDVANTPMELQEAVQTVLRQNPIVMGDRSVVQGLNQSLLGIDVVNNNIAQVKNDIAQLKTFIAKEFAPEAGVRSDSYYLKGDEKPEVYALDIATGKLRHVQSAEFNIITAIGGYHEVEQVRVEELLKEGN